MKYNLTVIIALLMLTSMNSAAQTDALRSQIESHIEQNCNNYLALYKHLHQNPELSLYEVETAKRMAKELQTIGFEVTKNFGGNSLVGIYRNGDGPTIMLRTDMDALPIEEKTGLPYASTIKFTTPNGETLPVMHACGHDMHMTVFMGTLNTLVALKKQWKGTIMAIAQQAEEVNGGSNLMIDAGLFKKFPVPSYGLAFHVSSSLPAGTVGVCPGPFFASVDDVDITVFGKGGHGAYPSQCIDPIVIASRIVLDLQTIISRELSPLSPAVVTVGSFRGGAQRNIIPDKVELSLTIRSYTQEARTQILAAIERIAHGAAITAGIQAPQLPLVRIGENPTPAVINDLALTQATSKYFSEAIGSSNVITVSPEMVGEDFGRYGQTPEKVPIMLAWLGGVDPAALENHKTNGTVPPPLHSPYFSPHPEKTIKTGVLSMSYAIIGLFNQKSNP